MTRRFSDQLIDDASFDRILKASTRAPSAGFTQAVEMLVLTSVERRALFWSLISDTSWRDESSLAVGLQRAPVVMIPLVDRGAYASRYSENDKANSLLGSLDVKAWPVPYWIVDAAFSTMLILLAVESEQLGALFFHLQGRERDLLRGLEVPDRFETIGAIALGHPEEPARTSAPRARRGFENLIHRDRW